MFDGYQNIGYAPDRGGDPCMIGGIYENKFGRRKTRIISGFRAANLRCTTGDQLGGDVMEPMKAIQEILEILDQEMTECSCTDGNFIYGCKHSVRRMKEICVSVKAPVQDLNSLSR